MKPAFELSDDDWKSDAFTRLAALGTVVAAVRQ